MARKRVFSEQEVAQLIRRAAEISESAGSTDYAAGVTEAELRRIAGEVGISPEALELALRETTTKRSSRKGPFHFTEEFERVVEGELDPERFDLLLEGSKPARMPGQIQMAQVGRSLNFVAWTGPGQSNVEVVARNGRTKLRVKSNALMQALMTLHPAFIGSVIALGALSERGMVMAGAGIAVGLTVVGGIAFRSLTKFGHRRAEELADSLQTKIEENIAPEAEGVTGDAPQADALEQRFTT
jgi:hypothetical protein